MEIRKVVTKRRIVLLLLVLFVLLILWVALTQPFVFHRLATRVFTGYEIYQLKYPDSYLVETETTATSKVTMATHYTYHTSDDIDTVREYMEQQRPGFVQMKRRLETSFKFLIKVTLGLKYTFIPQPPAERQLG
jgi:hypothetical protein